MKYDMVRPCENCPFRTDCLEGWLNRAPEIARGIVDQQGTFACHETTEFDDEGEHDQSPDEQHCAGALILLEKIGKPNQMMRISERLGLYDHRKLDMQAPVFGSVREFVKHHGKKPKRRKAPSPDA